MKDGSCNQEHDHEQLGLSTERRNKRKYSTLSKFLD